VAGRGVDRNDLDGLLSTPIAASECRGRVEAAGRPLPGWGLPPIVPPRHRNPKKTEAAMTIRVFVTGGTFDKEYDEIRGELYFEDTHLPDMMRQGRCVLDLEIRTLMMIDSLKMTQEDRELIAHNCAQVPEEQIVITHGTDTMVETARVLAASVGDKTIVLTGAMIPYAFGSSDGLFNLGSALSFVQVLPPGVYVAMNGRWFHWNDVRKNRETGRFEPLSEGSGPPPRS
jgi:L-asparaginase